MPILHLQVCAGFANRVRAMISGICLAEDLDCQLVIHWFPKSPECICRFQSVLDPESLPKTVKIVPEDTFQAHEVLTEEQWRAVSANWDKRSNLTIKSHGIFYYNDKWETYLQNLKPSRLVKEFLERRCASVPWSRAIGVHIRRTDHKKAIEHSPLDGFLKKMRENKEAFYVIATDSEDVRKEIELEFLDRCIFPAIVLSRRTEEGMIQGVADFFALAKCTQIWGSYSSSFSDIAARYGKLESNIIS